jgi:hypothetical protein
MLTLNRQKHLIHMPLVAWPGTAATKLIGILLPEFATPFAHGFIGHDDATFQQYFFHISKAQAEAEVQPHRMADDRTLPASEVDFRLIASFD